jgi:hypothetical protein
MANWPKSQVETFNDSVEEQFKISELNEKFDIKVSKAELKEYADTRFTMKEVQKIQEWISSVSELAKAKLDILRKSYEDSAAVQKSQETLQQALKKWAESANKSAKGAEEVLKGLDSSNITWEVWEAFKEGTKKAKEVWEKIAKAWYTVQLWEALRDSFTKMKNFNIWWALVSLFKWLFWMFTWSAVLEKAWEKIKEKLSAEEVEKTKTEIKKVLSEKFPWKEEKIENILNSPSVNQKQIKKIHEKIKSWEKITIKDISNFIPELKNIFTQKEKDEILLEAKQKAIVSIKKSIEKKYPEIWEITWDKLTDLEKLTVKYFNLSSANELVLKEIVENRWFQINDLYWLLFESTSKWTWFTLWLISKWIIPITAIWIDIIETSTDIFKVSLWWMWITEQVSYDDLMSQIWDIEHPELLLWLLYRKGWLLFSILWDISKVASQIAIENLTNTSVKSTNLIKSSFTNNFEKQALNFQKISEAMWTVDEKTTTVIKEATGNLNKIQKNYQILSILENSDNIELKRRSISKILGEKIPIDIDDLNKLKTHVSSKFTLPHLNISLSNGSLLNKFGFWKSSDLFELNRKLEFINKNQISILKNEHIAKGIWKIREVFEIWEVSRLWDKVIYHFDDIGQVSKFSILANKFPQLLGWLFDKLPIITVAGLAMANEDKIESLKTWLWSLVPFVWPIMLLWEWWVYLDENNEVVIKNPIEAWMWWVLLWLDSAFLIKEAIKWWTKWVWWYLIKPLKDIYSIWRWSIEAIDSIAKITKWTFIKETIQKWWKVVSKLWKPWKITAIAILWAYAGYEYLTDDDKEIYENLVKEWLINKNWTYWENLKKELLSWKINEDEKQILVELIVAKNSIEKLENIDLKIEWNELIITSSNQKIKSDFFINEQTINELNTLFWIKYNSNNFIINT